jgi:hypothetical protein
MVNVILCNINQLGASEAALITWRSQVQILLPQPEKSPSTQWVGWFFHAPQVLKLASALAAFLKTSKKSSGLQAPSAQARHLVACGGQRHGDQPA